MHHQANVLVRLNQETRSHHAPADRVWLELVANERVPTEQDYMRTLARVYGFEAPLEAAIAYTPELDGLVDMRGRYRSGLIAQDLLSLGLAPEPVANIRQCMLAPFSGVAEALGWLYVHERATLCHESARRLIVGRVPTLVRATVYLGAYAGVVGVRFDDFGQTLGRYASTPAIEDRIVAAAQDAFRMQLHWLDAAEATRLHDVASSTDEANKVQT